MALFQRKRFVWNEPWFFQQRIRTTGSWINLALLLIAIAGALGATLYFSVPAGQQPNYFEIIGMSLGAAAAVWWVFDGTETRRQAVLMEDSIVVGGDMGKYSSPETYKLSEIPGAKIVMPEESKWPEPALFFHYNGEEQAIGIDKKAGLTRLAQALYDVGLSIHLDGWSPDGESEFAKEFSWKADPNSVTGKAKMETLPEGSPSLMTPGGIILAIITQCWAIVLWLVIVGFAIYYGYQNFNNLGVVRLGLLIVMSIGTMYIAGVYTDRYASAKTAKGLTQMAKGQIRKREGLQVDPDGNVLLPVEIFNRDQFEKTVQVIHEMGFLQADISGKQMLYEGKKERWTIPTDSIYSINIEEVQSGTPGQSATGALNYYVVVQFAADEKKEFGFRFSERDYGDYDDVKRAQGGISVFDEFDELVSRL